MQQRYNRCHCGVQQFTVQFIEFTYFKELQDLTQFTLNINEMVSLYLQLPDIIIKGYHAETKSGANHKKGYREETRWDARYEETKTSCQRRREHSDEILKGGGDNKVQHIRERGRSHRGRNERPHPNLHPPDSVRNVMCSLSSRQICTCMRP